MPEQKQIRLLKISITLGLALLLLGHYLLSNADLPRSMGVKGMIISAACIAIGLVLSLPTKMYLTFLLMKRENKNRNIRH